MVYKHHCGALLDFEIDNLGLTGPEICPSCGDIIEESDVRHQYSDEVKDD